MAQANLNSPLVLNPAQAVTLRLERTTIDHNARVVHIHVSLLSSEGALLESRTIQADGAQIQTWITNQENLILTRLLARLGVTGTIS